GETAEHRVPARPGTRAAVSVSGVGEDESGRRGRARGAGEKRGRVAGPGREQAARGGAEKGADPLQARHPGDRAANLVAPADVRDVRLPAENPRRVSRAE